VDDIVTRLGRTKFMTDADIEVCRKYTTLGIFVARVSNVPFSVRYCHRGHLPYHS
jgi:hypothetical protein